MGSPDFPDSRSLPPAEEVQQKRAKVAEEARRSNRAHRQHSARMPFSIACGNAILPALTGISAIVFLGMGIPFAAPYWLYDGISFLLCCIVGYMAVRNWKHLQQGMSDVSTYVAYSRTTFCIAMVSVFIEIGFLATALLLWNQQMNPINTSSYGRDGSSFFFCSLYSSTTNVFVARHFFKLSRTPPSEK